MNATKKNDHEDGQDNIGWALENKNSCKDCYSEFQPLRKLLITSSILVFSLLLRTSCHQEKCKFCLELEKIISYL